MFLTVRLGPNQIDPFLGHKVLSTRNRWARKLRFFYSYNPHGTKELALEEFMFCLRARPHLVTYRSPKKAVRLQENCLRFRCGPCWGVSKLKLSRCYGPKSNLFIKMSTYDCCNHIFEGKCLGTEPTTDLVPFWWVCISNIQDSPSPVPAKYP
jgi:hypothetical protein